MAERDNKFSSAFENVTKRLLIDNAKTVGDLFLVKKVEDAIPVARTLNFFKNLKSLSDKWDLLIQQQGDKLRDLFDRLLQNYGAILKRKVVQWKDKAKKITQETAQRKIADFIVNKYKVGLARDNWQRLAKSLDTFSSNKDLYKLLRLLKKRIALQSMAKSIDDAFKKPALDQLKDGADYVSLINFLRRLFGDWENRNTISALHHSIKRWSDKVAKMRNRDEKIDKALSVLDKRVLSNTVATIADALLVKKFNDAIPAARAIEFFDKLVNKAQKVRALNDQQKLKIRRLVNRVIRFNDEILRRKLNQWHDTSKKVTEETCKRKIARLIENKYKTNIARDNWNKLID